MSRGGGRGRPRFRAITEPLLAPAGQNGESGEASGAPPNQQPASGRPAPRTAHPTRRRFSGQVRPGPDTPSRRKKTLTGYAGRPSEPGGASDETVGEIGIHNSNARIVLLPEAYDPPPPGAPAWMAKGRDLGADEAARRKGRGIGTLLRWLSVGSRRCYRCHRRPREAHNECGTCRVYLTPLDAWRPWRRLRRRAERMGLGQARISPFILLVVVLLGGAGLGNLGWQFLDQYLLDLFWRSFDSIRAAL